MPYEKPTIKRSTTYVVAASTDTGSIYYLSEKQLVLDPNAAHVFHDLGEAQDTAYTLNANDADGQTNWLVREV